MAEILQKFQFGFKLNYINLTRMRLNFFFGWSTSISTAAGILFFSSQFVVYFFLLSSFFPEAVENLCHLFHSSSWHWLAERSCRILNVTLHDTQQMPSSSFVSLPSWQAPCSTHSDWSELLFSQSQHHPRTWRQPSGPASWQDVSTSLWLSS